RSSGRHAAWGLLFALWPGFAYSLSMDTSELTASAFVLGGLLATRRRWWAAAALSLSAAAITRDTTIVVAAGVAAAGAWTLLRARSTLPVARKHLRDAEQAPSTDPTPAIHPGSPTASWRPSTSELSVSSSKERFA